MSQPAAEPRKEVPLTHYFGRGLTLDFGQTRQDALLAIINIFAECQQNPKKVNIVTVLAQISKYFGNSLDQNQSGKLVLDVGKHDWQLWTKYKKALSDFQSGYARDLKTQIIESYECQNRVTANEPYLLVDEDYSRLAIYIDGASPQPPVGVHLQYWYSITPHIFTISEARRAIDKVNQLHQEYQWATHGEGGWANKGLWLFVWRVLKRMWLNHCRDGHSFHRTAVAAMSQLEKPFLDEHTAIFNRMHRTSEILHFSAAQKLVLDFALRCYQTFPASQQEQFAKSAKLGNSSKECLHAFIHGKTDLTIEVVCVLRDTAARYYTQHLEESKRVEEHGFVMSVDEEPAEEDRHREYGLYPMPIALARKSAYDYVWYDMPDTRPREVAESRRIERDMTDPGIQSDGLRVSDLINLAPRHARRPGQVSRWNRFSPFIGPVSATWRLARYFLKGKKLVRREPIIPKRTARRQLVKPEPLTPPATPLPSVRDNARRVSKLSTPIRFPTVKLRGGGPKASPGWQRNWSREQGRLVADLARRMGIEQPTTDQANFLVGNYLTASEWNVKAAEQLWKENAIPPKNMHYDVQRFEEANNPKFAGLSGSKRRQIQLLMAALNVEQSVAVADDDIVSALEDQDWRWEAALTDLRAGHHPESSQARPSLGTSAAADESHFLSSFVAGDPQDRIVGAGHDEDDSTGKSSHSRRSRSRSSRLAKDDSKEQADLNVKSSISRSSSRRGGKSGSSGSRGASSSSSHRGRRPEHNGAGGALPSSSTVDSRRKLSERSKGPGTPPKQLNANEIPKRPIRVGSKGYVTDNRTSDDQSTEMIEVPPKRSSSPTRDAVARRSVRESQLAQQEEDAVETGTDYHFEIHDENGGLSAKSGLEDRIDELENGAGRQPSASGGLFDKEISRALHEMDEELEVCHPCPHYDGQYHHICNEHCCMYGAAAADAEALQESIDGREPAELSFETGSSPSARYGLLTVLDRDVLAVTSRESQGATLNELRLHARLQRILKVAATWPSGTEFNPILGYTPKWEQFLLPEPIEPNSTLSYEAFRRCHSAWHKAPSPRAKTAALEPIHAYIIALIEYHYARNSPGRCANSSDNVMRMETFRSFPFYHKQAQKLKRDLNGLADLFAEVDGFSGMEYRRSSHAEHHDVFRGAYSGLLSLRRGLGQVVPDAECDNAPRWSDYRAQGQAPNQELYDTVRVAVAAVDPLSAFFGSGDTEVDVDQSVAYLWDTICNIRNILYSGPNRVTPLIQRRTVLSNGLIIRSVRQRRSPSQPRTPTKPKRKVVDVDDETEDGASVPAAKKRRVAPTKVTSAPREGSSTGSPSLGPSDKENQPVLESIEKDEAEEEEESDESDEDEDQNKDLPDESDGDEDQDEEDETEDKANHTASRRALKPIPVRRPKQAQKATSSSKAKPAPKPKPALKPKAAPKVKDAQKAKPATEVPSAQDYSKIMYLDEIQQEIEHRGLEVKGEMVKANLVHHLVNADKAGNTGLGIMRSWRKMNDKKANQGSRPAKYKLPSVAVVKKKFGDRLV